MHLHQRLLHGHGVFFSSESSRGLYVGPWLPDSFCASRPSPVFSGQFVATFAISSATQACSENSSRSKPIKHQPLCYTPRIKPHPLILQQLPLLPRIRPCHSPSSTPKPANTPITRENPMTWYRWRERVVPNHAANCTGRCLEVGRELRVGCP